MKGDPEGTCYSAALPPLGGPSRLALAPFPPESTPLPITRGKLPPFDRIRVESKKPGLTLRPGTFSKMDLRLIPLGGGAGPLPSGCSAEASALLVINTEGHLVDLKFSWNCQSFFGSLYGISILRSQLAQLGVVILQDERHEVLEGRGEFIAFLEQLRQ